jgi:hypothetical protein
MAASTSPTTEAKVYKDEVIGRRVMVEFLIDDTDVRASFPGQIRKLKMHLLDDGTIETEHFILFDDNDTKWFDIVAEEELGRLHWIDDDRKPLANKTRIKQEDSVKREEESTGPHSVKSEESSTAVSVKSKEATPYSVKSDTSKESSPKRPAQAVPVTPERKIIKKKQKMLTGGTPHDDWLNEMEDWLKKVPHGASQKVVSEVNAKSVMRQVRKLVSGEGITYKHWPVETFFYKDTKVDLTFDFGQMHDEAVRIEDTHGRDKGNGWLLKHPIRKLELYQEYTGMEPHIQY